MIPLYEYFPDCVLPDCTLPDPYPLANGQHTHIMPHQQAILHSTADILFCQGGVGSGKSLPFAVKTVKLMMDIPDNVGIVSRLDYKLMFKSCWLDVKQILRRLYQKEYLEEVWYTKKMFKDKRQGDHTTIYFPNGSVLYAMQGKAWEEGLGASYGMFWVDDAMESQEEMFVGNDTSAGLFSRLRLPHVRFFREGSTVTNKLQGLVSSNPPPIGSWIHKLFGSKPGMHTIGDLSVEWIMCNTYDNPFIDPNRYAKGIMSVQSRMGRNDNVARRVIYGESIPAYGGTPVYPQFDHATHIAPLKYRPDLPVVVGVDFGYQHPAATFSNLYRCKYHNNHYFTLSEVADCFNQTVYTFYDGYLKPHIDRLYPGAYLLWGGDRAGYRTSASNKDRRGDMKILIQEYKIPFHWRFLNLAPSLQYMRGLLKPKAPCPCGLPFLLVSNRCPVLIGAMEGGYRYTKHRDGTVAEKPYEDCFFADVACAHRYGAENYVRGTMSWQEQKQYKQRLQEQHLPTRQVVEHPLDWLNKTDAQLVALIR